jgi:hypothetical protein
LYIHTAAGDILAACLSASKWDFFLIFPSQIEARKNGQDASKVWKEKLLFYHLRSSSWVINRF